MLLLLLLLLLYAEFTFMIEINDKRRRERQLRQLLGIEEQLFLEFGGHKVMSQSLVPLSVVNRPERTSSIHFLKFQLDEEQRADLRQLVHGDLQDKDGKERSPVIVGCDHPEYSHMKPLPVGLLRDLEADIIH